MESLRKVGKDTKITNSAVGYGCKIGCNVLVEGCHIWSNVTIEDGCILRDAVLYEGAVMKAGAVLEPGVVLSYNVVVGKGIVVPGGSKVCLLPQPDSDEDKNGDMGEDGLGFIWPSDEVEDEEPTPELDADKYLEEMVERIFLRAVDIDAHQPVYLGFIIDELHSLQVGFGMCPAECACALLHAMMKFALDTSKKKSGKNVLFKETNVVISKWQELLKPFAKFAHEQIQVISKFEEMCLEPMKEYAPLFVHVLRVLYDEDIVQEEAILKWAHHTDNTVFVKQSEAFVQCLKHETHSTSFSEGGVRRRLMT